MTEEDDAFWVTTKLRDIIIDPFHSSIDIEETKILSLIRACELRGARLTENVNWIVEGDNEDIIVVSNDMPAIMDNAITLR